MVEPDISQKTLTPSAVTEKSGEVKIDEERLIRLLDSEIHGLEDEQSKNGWTIWAIWGALGSFVWILLDVIHRADLSKGFLENVAFLALSFFFSADFFSLLCNQFGYQEENSRDIRFLSSKRLAQKRGLSFFHLIRAASLMTLTFLIPDVNFLIRISYLFMTLLFFVITVLSFLSLPIPQNTKKNKGIVVFKITLDIFLMAAVYWQISIFSKTIFLFNKMEFRIALLIFAVFFLVEKLTQLQTLQPQLMLYREIRRKLFLLKLNSKEAENEIETLLWGSRTEHVLEKDVVKIVTILSRFSEMIGEARKYQDRVSEIIKKIRGEMLDGGCKDPKKHEEMDKDFLTIDALFKQYHNLMPDFIELAKEANGTIDKMLFGVKFIERITGLSIDVKGKEQLQKIMLSKENLKKDFDCWDESISKTKESTTELKKICEMCHLKQKK